MKMRRTIKITITIHMRDDTYIYTVHNYNIMPKNSDSKIYRQTKYHGTYTLIIIM